MHWRLLKVLLILPGTVLVVVPAAIVFLSSGSALQPEPAAPLQLRFWLALASAGAGLALGAWTTRLFLAIGAGTPAPWDPPRRLVVRGPYRHVRNPMISGVLLILLGEALLLGSWPVAAWLLVFFCANAAYFPLVEEKALARRFGDDYLQYRRHVPRWLPRPRPWKGDAA